MIGMQKKHYIMLWRLIFV